jgi:hypothetical protein
MPKITKEVEDDNIEVRKPKEKLDTFVVRWFRDHAVENHEDMKMISDLTDRSVEQQFAIVLDPNNKHTEVYAVLFYGTFLTILEFIKNKQKKYNNYAIRIANSINIGYTNNDNDDNEKVGNFMPIIEYVGVNMNYIDTITNEELNPNKTSKNCIGWMNLNIKHNAECYKDIQEKAYHKLYKDFRLDMRTSEAIIPIFCIFMDHINNVVKLKFKEAEGTDISETHMNVLGLFDVFYSYNEEDDQEIWEYVPSITTKLALKSDTMADRG